MIGILTFVGTQSHGACLQAYALRSAIKRLGYDAEIVNYQSKELKRSMDKRLPSGCRGFKKKAAAFVRYPIIKKRYKKFRDFEANYLQLGELRQSYDPERYDRIIVGSDQVWNLSITGNDYQYFLENVSDPQKKYSYAASLGTDVFPKDAQSRCFALIDQFQMVNVRETQLAEYIQKGLPQKQCNVVVDPTLLLSADEWGKLVSDPPILKYPYLLAHYPADTKENWDAIYKLAQKHGLKIVFITNQIKKSKGCISLYAVSPTEYLNYIKNATLIVSGSFHTLCFSLIFNKQFYYTGSFLADRNARLSNLMRISACEDRNLAGAEEDKQTEIDYEKTNKLLQEEETRSLKILERACNCSAGTI